MVNISVTSKANPREKNDPYKYYASPQVTENVSMDEFADILHRMVRCIVVPMCSPYWRKPSIAFVKCCLTENRCLWAIWEHSGLV